MVSLKKQKTVKQLIIRMINLNYEYKLKLNKEQISKADFTLEGCRKVYNYALRERKDWINSRKCPHCGYTVQRDVASSIIIQQRGERAVGLPVRQIAFGGDVTGGVQLNLFSLDSLVGTR